MIKGPSRWKPGTVEEAGEVAERWCGVIFGKIGWVRVLYIRKESEWSGGKREL